MAKHMKELLEDSEAFTDSDLRTYLDPSSFVMAIDTEISMTCNYPKVRCELII